MSYIYDTTSRYRPHVHWTDESNLPSGSEETHLTQIKRSGQRISLNASLPYYSKLNIRINANRIQHNHIKTIATVQRIDPRYQHEYTESLQDAYNQHYSTVSSNEIRERNIPIQYEKLPLHRPISLPISLPVDQRLFLYIRNGEVFARC